MICDCERESGISIVKLTEAYMPGVTGTGVPKFGYAVFPISGIASPWLRLVINY
jgi:hypothetical protein